MNQVVGMICPKCGGQHIFAGDKGFSGAKAVGGAVLTGGIGLLAGLHGSKRIRFSCTSCGYSWVPEEERKRAENMAKAKRRWKLSLIFWIPLAALILWIYSQQG